MTDKTYIKPKKLNSLYVRLIMNIFFGVLIAALTYLCLRIAADYYIQTRYMSAEEVAHRVKEHVTDLQEYATDNKISSEDTSKIAKWAKNNPYVYLMVYKDDVLLFSPDMEEDEDSENDNETPEESPGSGADSSEDSTDGESSGSGEQPADPGQTGDGKPDSGKEEKPDDEKNDYDIGGVLGGNKYDRETLIKQAKANGLHPIELVDGTIIVNIADYSEKSLSSLSNLLSIVVGIFVFAILLIVYFRRIISRLKKLESDVNIVSHVNMNHKIVCKGKDEISMLSRNVENMRNSMVDNLEKERAARAANTELVAAMSHDIRTPLTVLLGYIDMMKNYEGCDETVKSYISATEKTAMRLKDLSDDMFKYSLAFGSTDEQIALESYDAGMLIEQLFYEHILLLSENGYEVHFDRKLDQLGPEAEVRTDPQNLMRIVDNIFQNIYKYANINDPIMFSCYAERNRIRFVIRNKITDEPDGAESNGIGLKTCKRLAQYIADEFSYENDGEYFTVNLALKLIDNKQKGKK